MKYWPIPKGARATGYSGASVVQVIRSRARPVLIASRHDLRLVPSAIAVWLSIASTLELQQRSRWALLVVALGGAAALGARSVTRNRPSCVSRLSLNSPHRALSVAALLVAAACGLWATEVEVETAQRHLLAAKVGDTVEVELLIRSGTTPLRSVQRPGWMVPVHIDYLNGRQVRGSTRVLAHHPSWSALPVGTRVRARAKVLSPRTHAQLPALAITGAPTNLASPKGFDRIAAGARARFAGAAATRLPPELAALLPALVLGDESASKPEIREHFRRSGLAHLTAVSGANIAYVVAGATAVVAIAGASFVARFCAAAVALAVFVLIVGPSPSVIRAAATAMIALLAILTSRRRLALHSLAFTVIVTSILAPGIARGVGFVLSVVVTAALVVVGRPAVQQLRRFLPLGLAELLAIAVVAQCAVTPLIVVVSGEIQLWGLIANIAVAPAVVFIAIGGTVAAVAAPLSPALAELLCAALAFPLWWMSTVAVTVSGFPGAVISVSR